MRKIILLLMLLTTSVGFASSKQAEAIFAGGCFWCMQHAYDNVAGVIKTVVGYTGGHVKKPSYAQVTTGRTGHYEAIKVYYNPSKISYQRLLHVFWRNIDPTDARGQFCDRGSSYRSAIFYKNAQQKRLAISSKKELLKSKRFKKIVTPI